MLPKAVFIFLIFFLTCRLSSNGQTESHPGNIYLGAFFMPGYNDAAKWSGHFILPYKTGLDIKFRLTNRISLSTGITLFVQTYKFSFDIYSFKNQLSTFQLPLRADFRLGDKKVAPLLTTGFITDLYQLLKYRYTYNYSGSINTQEGTNRSFQIHSWLQLGFGVDINVKRFKFQAFPLCEATIYNWRVSDHAFQAGFVASVLYRL